MKDGKRESLIELEVVVHEEQREEFLALLNAKINELRLNRSLRSATIQVASVDEDKANDKPSIRIWPIH